MFQFRRFFAVLLGVLLLLGTAGPVRAAAPEDVPLGYDEAIEILQTHGIVRGDPFGNLNLGSNLTRAEAAAIYVRAMNMSALAAGMADQVPFSDAKGHWGAGDIALAYRLGLMKGDPDGRFRPKDQITYAEVLTVLLRMIGREPAGKWDPAVILWRASEVGILPDGITSSAPAVRQKAFWALAAALTVPVDGGRNLLARNFDFVPPALLVANVESPTTAERTTLQGTAAGAYKVLVNGQPATYQRSTGAWNLEVNLAEGRNTFVVEAFDRAGNAARQEVVIERRPAIAKIEITGPEYVAPNTTVKLEITAYDKDGKEVPLEGAEASLSTKAHSFDLARKTLKTGSTKGKATLTVSVGAVKGTYTFHVQGPSADAASLRIDPINEGRAPAPDRKYTVTVTVLNEKGEVATDDYGRKVELEADDDAVTITPRVAETVAGVATFTVEFEEEATYLLTASSSGLDEAELEVEVLSSPRVVLVSSEERLEPDGESETWIRAVLQDDRGRAIEASSDIEIELWNSGVEGELDGYYLTIPKGRSSSSDRVAFIAGFEAGKAIIEGYVYSSREYPVQTLVIPVKFDEDGPRFVLSASDSRPEVGDEVRITLRVVDENNRTRTSGSYAFQIRVRTSNNDPIGPDGLPDGVELRFVGSGYSPAYGGEGDHIVVGRTYKGKAELILSYDKEGTVTLVPIGVGRTQEAYNPDDPKNKFAEASSGRSFGGQPQTIRFRD